MCFQMSFDHRENVVYICVAPGAGYRTAVEAMLSAASDPRLALDYGVLIDMRQTEYAPSHDEVMVLAAAELASFSKRPCALITGSALQFRVGYMIARYCEWHGGHVDVFADLEVGRNWLLTVVAGRRQVSESA